MEPDSTARYSPDGPLETDGLLLTQPALAIAPGVGRVVLDTLADEATDEQQDRFLDDAEEAHSLRQPQILGVIDVVDAGRRSYVVREAPADDAVRLLGEDLVAFLDKSGRVGLIADKCPHRNASLVYGRVEERGISCAYHGWLMDCDGNIIETPPERNDAIMKNVKAVTYPVQTFIGLYWAYLGPLPAPVIPHFDLWVRKDGTRSVKVRPVLDCNWLQPMENSADSPHLEILHQMSIGGDRKAVNTTRGFIDDVESYQYHTTDWGGLIKTRTYKNGKQDAHPLIFPDILRVGDRTQIRVPMDDEHTHHFVVTFTPSANGEIVEQDDFPVGRDEPYKHPADKRYPEATYDLDQVPKQDYMEWETQGPVADRTKEHLSFGDRGVVLYRKMLRDSIDRVARGEDPWGLQRDPGHATIDTNLDQSLEWERVGRPAGINTETVTTAPDAEN